MGRIDKFPFPLVIDDVLYIESTIGFFVVLINFRTYGGSHNLHKL